MERIAKGIAWAVLMNYGVATAYQAIMRRRAQVGAGGGWDPEGAIGTVATVSKDCCHFSLSLKPN